MTAIKCTSCDKQRAELHPRKSKLVSGMTIYLCNECDKAKMEPRFLIIIHGRTHGAESVADYVKKHRYVGEPILAKELVA